MTEDSTTTPPYYSTLLLKYSPKHARTTWIYVNSFVLTCSILLLIEIFMTLEPADRLEGTRAYLTYNTIVCFFWTVESALHFLQYRHDQNEEKQQQQQEATAITTTDGSNDNTNNKWDSELIAIIVELLFAIYFLFDAVTTFQVMWQQPSGVGAQLFDVLIDAAAYIYLLIRLVLFTEEDENNNETPNDDEGTTTPYVGAEMT